MVAGESGGDLERDVEIVGAVGLEEFPLEFRFVMVLGSTRLVQTDETILVQAFFGRRLAISDRAKRKLEPSHVIRRHFVLHVENLKGREDSKGINEAKQV